LLITDRLLQRQNDKPPAKAGNQYRWPIFMVSDLNSDNRSGIEWFKPQFELAGVLFYIRKIPKDLSFCIENGRRESGAAQHLSPRIE
jgi:hypothetical protein